MPHSSTDAISDVAIVGAGPYGLSLAAHLRARGVNFRIFGSPMKTWRDHMPPGMLLKSDGFASNLSDLEGSFTLGRFCQERDVPYYATGTPVSLETFVNYGLAFQQKMVPELEENWVTGIGKTGDGFQLALQSGEQVRARRVVLAIGITHYAYLPPELAGLGPDRALHTSNCGDGGRFRGKKVTIVGAGASAMDTAAYLHESGAEVTVIARSPNIYFGEPPSGRPRPLCQRIRHPSSGIGASLRSRIYCDAPWLFRLLPLKLRLRIVKRHLGPASGWPLRERVMGRVPLFPSTVIRHAEPAEKGVALTLAGPDGVERAHHADFVVCGTGYRVDLERLPFLPAELRSRITTEQNSPMLSLDFESSLPGLYFAGVSAANSFGPMMRFAFGRTILRASSRDIWQLACGGGDKVESGRGTLDSFGGDGQVYLSSRLAMVLADAGFLVEAVCPRGHLLTSTSVVKGLHHYSALRGVSSLKSAILKANPAIVLPCDDLARNHLHRLYETGQRAGAQSGGICGLIERSLGDPMSYPELESRSRLLALIRKDVDAAMETTVVSSPGSLKDWLAANGFPAVLKTDGSSGGYGVRVVSSFEEAEIVRRKLSAPPSLARAVKRALFNHNRTFLLPAWQGASPVVNAQKFIKGVEATSTTVCWQGTVMATLTFEVLRVVYPGGPASVVRLIQNPTIDNTIRKTVTRLGLSGFCGFDFIIENGTGIPYLIEVNSRATQTAHLRLGAGRDTANALFAAVTGKDAGAPVNEIKGDMIALFPQEWIRDPASEFLKAGFHDVPWSEPTLLEGIAASVGKRGCDFSLSFGQESPSH